MSDPQIPYERMTHQEFVTRTVAVATRVQDALFPDGDTRTETSPLIVAGLVTLVEAIGQEIVQKLGTGREEELSDAAATIIRIVSGYTKDPKAIWN